jgi:hypothetical protein
MLEESGRLPGGKLKMKLFKGFNFNTVWKGQRTLLLTLWLLSGMFLSAIPVYGVVTVERLSYSSLLYLNGDFTKAGSSGASDMKNVDSAQLMVMGVDFRGTVRSDATSRAIADGIESAAQEVKAEVIGKPLFYPNPARQTDKPKFWYVLSKSMDVQIRIYDMMANMILKSEFPAGSQGGKAGANWLSITDETFDQHKLSAGVYFVLIMHDGKVLGKGKVAILP